MPRKPDVLVVNHGTVWTFDLRSPEAATWVDDNVQSEDWQWGGSRLTVDWRFGAPLADGMRAAGLEVA